MEFLHKIAAVLLVAWLPGAVLFRVPWLDRERRAALDPEERLFWSVLLSVSWSVLFALALAALGTGPSSSSGAGGGGAPPKRRGSSNRLASTVNE